MARDEKISLFYRKYTQEQREIIDYLSGFIFETFPNIKEEINEDNLKYISADFGSLFLIKIVLGNVNFYFKKKKVSKIHTFKQEKKYFYMSYLSLNEINKKILISIFSDIKKNNFE